MKTTALFLMLLLAGLSRLQASDSAAHRSFRMEGQLSITTNFNALYFSIGGATFRMNFRRFNTVFIFMPILRLKKEPPKPFISPTFGAGIQFHILKSRRLILSAPFAYNNMVNKWQFSAGIGYVLTNK